MTQFPVLRADAGAFPAIAALRCTFPNGELVGGSGTLIAPRLLLTAGHVLFDPSRGGQVTRAEATFGGDGGLVVAAAAVDFPTDWRDPQSALDSSLFSPVDFGVVRLASPVDRAVAPWRFETIGDGTLTTTPLSVGGYPVQPPDGTAFGTLWGNTASAVQGAAIPDGGDQYEEFRLFYPIETLAGMSGGPVYGVDRATGTRTVYGVHTALIDWSDGTTLGSGRRIDDEARRAILGWVADLGGA
jgi:V8-like Glu-specific endopeptidase